MALHVGDLTHIQPDEAVDVLVVSAFPDDYVPTAGSLVGALHQAGLSEEQLASRRALSTCLRCNGNSALGGSGAVEVGLRPVIG